MRNGEITSCSWEFNHPFPAPGLGFLGAVLSAENAKVLNRRLHLGVEAGGFLKFPSRFRFNSASSSPRIKWAGVVRRDLDG